MSHLMMMIIASVTPAKKPAVKKCCTNCWHSFQENTTDVACCNCCEDYEYFDPVPEELAINLPD